MFGVTHKFFSLLFIQVVMLLSTPPLYAADKGSTAVKSNEISLGSEVSRVDVPFLTVRNKNGVVAADGDGKDDSAQLEEYFGGKRGVLHSGICSVTYTPVDALKSIADNVPFYVPEEMLQLEVIRDSAVKDFWKNIKKTAQGRSPFIYTHGFNISFARGCRRASEFQRGFGLDGRFVLFSWPSDGIIVNYTQDETDLYWSVDHLQKTLGDMLDVFGTGEVNVLAHSLGTRGTMLALLRLSSGQRFAKQRAAGQPLFDQVVLLAADTDAGIFKQYLPYIKPLAKRITIYVSSHDAPLAASEQLHGYPRLGQTGSHLNDLTGIEVIDVSDVPVQYPSGHLYHLYNKVVIDDLKQLLDEDKAAAQRKRLKKTGDNYWRLQPPT